MESHGNCMMEEVLDWIVNNQEGRPDVTKARACSLCKPQANRAAGAEQSPS